MPSDSLAADGYYDDLLHRHCVWRPSTTPGFRRMEVDRLEEEELLRMSAPPQH